MSKEYLKELLNRGWRTYQLRVNAKTKLLCRKYPFTNYFILDRGVDLLGEPFITYYLDFSSSDQVLNKDPVYVVSKR